MLACSGPAIFSAEELRETLEVVQRENDRLRRAAADAGQLLEALGALLSTDAGADPFAKVFASLSRTFTFSQIMALVEREGEAAESWVDCIASEPPSLVGVSAQVDALFRKVIGGKVTATFTSRGVKEWSGDLLRQGLTLEQPALYIPIQVRQRRGLVIMLRGHGEPGFDRSDMVLAGKFAVLASHALAIREGDQSENESRRLLQLSEELTRRAYYDQLTGLANRDLMQQRVQAVLNRGSSAERFALAFIDIDKFKQINDFYSHAIGDAVLIELARRVQRLLRPGDLLARISGDEFVLMLNPIESAESLSTLVTQLIAATKRPFEIESYQIFSSASVGIALYPDHGRDYETLRRSADSAMYRAKSAAKGTATYFVPDMGQALTAQMELEQRLRLAIRDRQFHCVFQPKLAIGPKRVVGFEALLRWRDHHGVVHSPTKFIDLAGELGLADEITELVLEKAIEALDVLDPCFGAGTTMSINLAARQAGDLAFMTRFAGKLAGSGRAPRLMLELTEDAFIATHQFQHEVLPLLQAQGVRVSIDDFGTGYSSLSVLAGITVDEIKVDRSFITGIHERPRSQSILKAIESLGQTLGLVMVAEGVETAQELAYLAERTSIELVQGYHFAVPALAQDLIRGPLRPSRINHLGQAASPADTAAPTQPLVAPEVRPAI